MKQLALAYVTTALIMLGLDAIWLGGIARGFYRAHIGGLLADQVSLSPAILFYLVYVAGILVFAVYPAFAAGRWTVALTRGALFGLVAYATYDLTNQATLKGWPVIVTIADLCWGVTLSALSASGGYVLTGLILGAKAD